MEEPRAYYTEWNMSERERQTLYINAYIWNLEKLSYSQGSNGDIDIENRLVDMRREGEGETNWESSTETYTLSYVKLNSGNLLYDTGS